MARVNADAPGGNWERWSWDDPTGKRWRCSECGARADKATHIGKDGAIEPYPYNLHQSTCGPSCASSRKLRRQAERRQEARRERAVTRRRAT